MNRVLGCVLAIRDRPAEMLERTLQTYACQTLQPVDKVLLDYGSAAKFTEAYRALCQRFGWRLTSCLLKAPCWHLSAAYNAAVAALHPQVDLVFKSDVDVLLGQDVLETAAVLGSDKLCIFSCLAAAENTTYPAKWECQKDLVTLLNGPVPLQDMPGEGLHAFPRAWFTEIGGFDLDFNGWGFEDSDLRERAKGSIGVRYVTTCLLIHQWHPFVQSSEDEARSRAHYKKMAQTRQLVRNVGLQPNSPQTHSFPPAPATSGPLPVGPLRTSAGSPRIAVATRSMNPHLVRESGRCLGSGDGLGAAPAAWPRHCITGTDAVGYFRELLALEADWVINLDEDAFVLDPNGLISLIRSMEEGGYAACGMPDGGVVPIRRHNPAACNAYFNIFDLRRVRPVWQNWDRVRLAQRRAEYEQGVPAFARRSTFAFDHFERYYGVFFSLLDAGQRILYLDAEEWRDGVSTLLKNVTGEALLIHCWYSRHWQSSYHTRRRYQRVIDYALKTQGIDPGIHAGEAQAKAP